MGMTYQVRAQSFLTVSNKADCDIKITRDFCTAGSLDDYCPPNSEVFLSSPLDLKAVFLQFATSNNFNLEFISGPCGVDFDNYGVEPHSCMLGWVTSEQPWQGGTWFSVGVW